MYIHDVKQKARLRQIAMSPGKSTLISSYNEKILNSQPNQRSYTYRTRIMDKITSVTLFFTKTSRKLYKINVRFIVISLKPEERKYFFESLFTYLSDKYGNPKHMKKVGSSNVFSDFILRDTSFVNKLIIWKKNNNNTISLNYNKNYQTKLSYDLTYENLPLVLQNKKEITYDLQQRTDKAILRDGSKL